MKHTLIFRTASPLIIALIVSCFAAITTQVSATDITVQKLFGHWSKPPVDYALGDSAIGYQNTACSDTWILVGASYAAEQASNQGAVQVFATKTGAWVRKLLPPAPVIPEGNFGNSCALSGNIAVVGAPDDSGVTTGAAYLFDLSTGKLLRTLKSSDGTAGDRFGVAVAISGRKVIVGAPGKAGQGAAYLFDLSTGAQLAKLTASDAAMGGAFGCSLAAEGNVAVVGSQGINAARGAGYAFDLTTYAQIKKVQPAASAAGNQTGISTSMHQGKVAFGSSAGKVFVVDLITGAEFVLTSSFGLGGIDHFGQLAVIRNGWVFVRAEYGLHGAHLYDLRPGSGTETTRLAAPDFINGFTDGMAVSDNAVVIAAGGDNSQGNLAGAVYVFRNVTHPLPLTKVAARGEMAGGAAEITFATFGDPVINGSGDVAFSSTLGGAGSNAGKDSGAWSTLGSTHLLDLVLKSRQADGAVSIASVTKAFLNHTSAGLLRATLSGTGVTTANNQALYWDDGSAVSQFMRTGVSSTPFGGAAVQSFTQVIAQSGAARWAVACTLKNGASPVTPTNDSGIFWSSTMQADTLREGSAAGATGLTYGQFTGRVAGCLNRITYPATISGAAAAANSAVFQKTFGMGEEVVAKKGDNAPGTGTATFSTFVGETSDDSESVLFRATLNAPATVADNEGLWTRAPAAAPALVMRKGDAVPGLSGVKIGKFINFWLGYKQTFALVQLTGTGVTAANDQALLLYQYTPPVAGQVTVLMREGEPASGCDGASIGVISRVEVDPFWGHYLVLSTLAGAPAGTEQALFRGFSHRTLGTADEQTLRRPALVLRKGQTFDNQPGSLKSISLPTTTLTAAGAGGTGLGGALQVPSDLTTARPVVLTIEFANGVRQMVKGIP